MTTSPLPNIEPLPSSARVVKKILDGTLRGDEFELLHMQPLKGEPVVGIRFPPDTTVYAIYLKPVRDQILNPLGVPLPEGVKP